MIINVPVTDTKAINLIIPLDPTLESKSCRTRSNNLGVNSFDKLSLVQNLNNAAGTNFSNICL